MIVEIPDDNSIVKWRYKDNEDWKSAEISDLIKAYEREYDEGFNAGYAEAIKNIPEYRKLANKLQRPQGGWIPVSKRSPEEKLFNPSGSDFGFDFEEVLCTTIWGDVRAYKFGKPIGHDKPHFWYGCGIMDEYVIAWQYKPEPYHGEDMRGEKE